MTYINVTTKMFFDRPGIIAAMSDKSRKCLSGALAFGRKVMQRGMRRRKGVSVFGDYPSAHKNSLMRDYILFGLNTSDLTGIVGPTLLSKDKTIVQSSKTTPELINEGGIVFRRVLNRGTGLNKSRGTRVVRQYYRPRPFIALTLPKTAAKLAENFAKFPLKKVS